MSGSPSSHNPTVNVNLPRRGSSLGIASLVLGVIAFTICWIPLLGMLGIPLSGLGLLLGIVGLIVAATRKGSGIGFPIAGALTCGISLVVAISLNYAIAEGIDEAGKSYAEAKKKAETSAANRSEASNRLPQRGSASEQETLRSDDEATQSRIGNIPNQENEKPDLDDPIPNNKNSMVGENIPEKSEPDWVPADQPFVRGDVQIKIIDVKAGLVPLEGIGGTTGKSQEPELRIQVEVTNQSQSRKIDYETLVGPDMGFKKHCSQLKDNFGNDYNRISFGFSTNAAGHTKKASIYPGKSITDVLVFQTLIDTIEFLELTLPLKSVGLDGVVVFRIPKASIKETAE